MKKFKNIIVISALLTVSLYSQAYYKVQENQGELTKKVNLWGYVNAPGRYELPASANLIHLITLAGGPKDHASLDEIVVYRIKEDGIREKIDIDLKDLENINSSNLVLYNEDIIYVDYNSIIVWREVFGFVAAPLSIISSIVFIIWRLSN